jgi:hypothetical protein
MDQANPPLKRHPNDWLTACFHLLSHPVIRLRKLGIGGVVENQSSARA